MHTFGIRDMALRLSGDKTTSDVTDKAARPHLLKLLTVRIQVNSRPKAINARLGLYQSRSPSNTDGHWTVGQLDNIRIAFGHQRFPEPALPAPNDSIRVGETS